MSRINAIQQLDELLKNFEKREVNGYLQVQLDGKWEWLHRIIAAEKMGADIFEGFEVHHIDGNKQNNHPDNLKVLSKEEHQEIHQQQYENEPDKKQEVKDYISSRIKHIQSSGRQQAQNNETADSYTEEDIAQLRSRLKKARIKSMLSEFRNDRYGSGQFEGICTRCGGTGYLSEYSYVEGGVCFACGGSGRN